MLPSSGRFVRGLNMISSKSIHSWFAAFPSSLNAFSPMIALSKPVPPSVLRVSRSEPSYDKGGKLGNSLLTMTVFRPESTWTSFFQTRVNWS